MSGASEGAKERLSGASERANGRASGRSLYASNPESLGSPWSEEFGFEEI